METWEIAVITSVAGGVLISVLLTLFIYKKYRQKTIAGHARNVGVVNNFDVEAQRTRSPDFNITTDTQCEVHSIPDVTIVSLSKSARPSNEKPQVVPPRSQFWEKDELATIKSWNKSTIKTLHDRQAGFLPEIITRAPKQATTNSNAILSTQRETYTTYDISKQTVQTGTHTAQDVSRQSAQSKAFTVHAGKLIIEPQIEPDYVPNSVKRPPVKSGYRQQNGISSYGQSTKNKTLDLHQFTLKQAMSAFKMFLDDSITDYIESEYSRADRFINVITGRGLHSYGGIPIIKPAVENYLSKHDYTYNWSNPGMVRIDLISVRDDIF